MHTSRPPAAHASQKSFCSTFNNLGFQVSRLERTEKVRTGYPYFVIFRDRDALARASPPSRIASDCDSILGARILAKVGAKPYLLI